MTSRLVPLRNCDAPVPESNKVPAETITLVSVPVVKTVLVWDNSVPAFTKTVIDCNVPIWN